ncbi:hypothetical protein K493DRAFT_257065 [Basidiobolus meristosporus CBS 931.73]|uniref:Uncharacterized protein n=1 Tax=Basidiobolus meristosporus CBS 931.73 TaxID=1314790 RepID=A0A1Y1YP05_9FUNG|nr:hypothetical protein K493DRAFT_257065 [Basidiobolus meristosporus CBS 931.73]|eukprot:ORX99732.1 hypothetical protein K493DRAFT_257065 [Basidiobolus meristosporus CBS 931.73]
MEVSDMGPSEASDAESESDLSDLYSDDDGSSKNKSKHRKTKLGPKVKYKPNWAVPYDPVVIPMGERTVEKLLAHRHSAQDPSKEELLVKYKNMSYFHAEWVPRERVEQEHLGKNRIKRFLDKQGWDTQWGEDQAFNPSFLKIDRIIDEGELSMENTDEESIYFLVKWCGSPYDQSTWEKKEDVMKMDPQKIEEFHQRRVLSESRPEKPTPRPTKSRFDKLKESPLFKHGNQLRPYQLEGLNWLLFCWFNQQSCIMADEMGLGKTVQSVSFLYEVFRTYNVQGPFLVVAPLSTIPHWEREFKGWTEMNTIVFHGSVTSRNLIVDSEFYYKDANGEIVPNFYKFDVVITTYEMITAGSVQLQPIKWRVTVFDEAHRLKNKTSKVLEMLKTYHLEHRLLLTGTPLQNSMHELFSLLNFLQPDRFYDEKAFLDNYGSLKTSSEVDKVQKLLKPLMLRRFKEDVESSIPMKEETVIEVELTSVQKKWYRAILEKNFTWLKKGSKGNSYAGPSLINVMMELRKCCMHPYLIQGAEERILEELKVTTSEDHLKYMIEASGKLVLVDKLLKKLKDGGHKVLIFSQMTRCLDILADYLRARNYGYERIDGSIRGEMRQAAIDRFSTTPDSFVFLLCTRAGGVGINLTAADTCVIYDSDWNPQNDLQAQARCHRIGQTKPVQIYRLITRNTYEKEMFDRAGFKLGLDKAVLQKMDATSAMQEGDDADISNASSSLSKKEVEELLKKGAYGALLSDDHDSAKFCEEDIDQILQRRTTVIKHEANEKGSVFSKATFSVGNSDDVDIDDPDFWDKLAKKANMDVEEEELDNPLIIHEPRLRRQVKRFGTRDQKNSDISEPNSDFEEPDDTNSRRKSTDGPRIWSLAEKIKLERKLMVHGYGRWEQMLEQFPRRSEKDLRAVTRSMIQHVLKSVERTSEEDVRLIEDINSLLQNDPIPGSPENNEEEKPNGDVENDDDGDELKPYPGATKKQIAEFKSFMIEAPQEYFDHIDKKGRNLLLRIQMLYTIRDKIVQKDVQESKDVKIPKVTGALPVDWWGVEEDRDLLIGICKYGYQQYRELRQDPELCFYGRKYIDKDEGNDPEQNGASEQTNGHDSNKEMGDADKQAGENMPALMWPSRADLGVRLRRIIAAFHREQLAEQRKSRSSEKEKEKKQQLIEKMKRKEELQVEKMRAKQEEAALRWSKKDMADFYRTLASFGVENLPDGTRTWEKFRELSTLYNKPDSLLDAQYAHMIKTAEAVIDSDGAGVASTGEHEGVVLTMERSKRLLKRVDVLGTVRERVLSAPDLEHHLSYARPTPGLPEWWDPKTHDKPFLIAMAKYGLNQGDLILADPELPFGKKDDMSASETEEANTELKGRTNGTWLKESVVLRRLDHLIDLVLNSHAHTKSRGSKAAVRSSSAASTPTDYSVAKKSGLKITLKLNRSSYDSDSDDSAEDTDEMLKQATNKISNKIKSIEERRKRKSRPTSSTSKHRSSQYSSDDSLSEISDIDSFSESDQEIRSTKSSSKSHKRQKLHYKDIVKSKKHGKKDKKKGKHR